MNIARTEDLPHYTYEDYLLWEGRWELIEGVPYAMSPAPSIEHQSTSSRLARLLEEAVEQCEPCLALLPVDWKIDDSTVVQPDNMVVCHQPDHPNYISRAPELIFEILSPSTSERDRNLKYRLYESEGVKYYAIVNHEDRIAKIYRLQDGRFVKAADVVEETFEFDLGVCNFNLDFSRVWKSTA
ncbi:MAG: Uma2 family endonuclease [Gammaproteobacteria bacterium]|jgi:Uma2 family endonuclease|nr:Uma2 family endonuclease [Gammaproteobacteria bacterium]